MAVSPRMRRVLVWSSCALACFAATGVSVGAASMPRDQGEREDSGPLALEGSPDEVVGMRDAVSRTFRQPDGRYATYVFAEPVNFRASDRRWYPIENRLVATGRAGFAVENKANRYSAFHPLVASRRRRAVSGGR